MSTTETKTESKNGEKLVLKEDTDIFHLLDQEDERQIILEARDRMKEALVYTIHRYDPKKKEWVDEDQLSYAGIQHIIILMSQSKDSAGSLELVDEAKCEMKSFNLTINDKPIVIQKWYASCKVRNTLTKLTTPGVAEADVVIKVTKKDPQTNKKIWIKEKNAYEMEDGYDDFGRNKAVSKAFRNACKIQIPQKLILEMIKIAKEKGQVKKVEQQTTQQTNSNFCQCSEPKPKFQTDDKGNHVCYTCNKPVKPDIAKQLLGT